MATNDYEIQVNTDDYDEFLYGGEPESLPGSPIAIDEQGHLVIPSDGWLVHQSHNPSVMDPENTGATTDFWSAYPITIDVNGDIFYYGENTGINVRGPAGETNIIRWEDLTPEQIELLKGADGTNGINGAPGRDGQDGQNGLSAYEEWLDIHGWSDHPEEHPISDFYQEIANLSSGVVVPGTGSGSVLINYKGSTEAASGAGATAFGNNTVASAQNSIAAGTGTTTSNTNQVSIGKYNDSQQNSLFEVGNGLNSSSRSNALTLDANGNLLTSGTITDGGNNILSNKVDKITGKALSTNDFTTNYKDWLDQYLNGFDTSVSSSSLNPVTSQGIYQAIEDAKSEVMVSKPQQESIATDVDLNFFHPYSLNNGDLNKALFSSGIQWNPYKKTLKMNQNITNSNVIALGDNLLSAANGQTIFGKYNQTNADHIFQIGNGISGNSRSNALYLTNTGNLKVSGTIEDGSGNKLNQKQNTLTYDNTVTEDSSNMVTSGKIYDYLVENGLNITYHRFEDPRTDQILTSIDMINSQLTTLLNMINAHELIDDTTGDTYTYGIDNDEFYIKLKEGGQ
jgi:hypothetical protein